MNKLKFPGLLLPLAVLVSLLQNTDAASRPCNCYNGEVWQEEPDCRCICYEGYFLPECRYTATDKVRLKVWINVTLKEFQRKGMYVYEQIFEKNLGTGHNNSDRIHFMYIDKVWNTTVGGRYLEKVSVQVQMSGQQAEYFRYDFVVGQHWLELNKIESAYPDEPAPTNPPDTVFWDIYFYRSTTYGNVSIYSLWWLILAIFLFVIFICMEFCFMQNIENIVWDHVEAGTLVYVGEEPPETNPEKTSLNSRRDSFGAAKNTRRSSSTHVDYNSDDSTKKKSQQKGKDSNKKQKGKTAPKTQEEFEKQAKSSKRGGFVPLEEEDSDEEMLVAKKSKRTSSKENSTSKRKKIKSTPKEDVASPKLPGTAAMEWSAYSGMSRMSTCDPAVFSEEETSKPVKEEGEEDSSKQTAGSAKNNVKNPLVAPAHDASISMDENPVKPTPAEPEQETVKPSPKPKPKPKPKGKFSKKATTESPPVITLDTPSSEGVEEPPAIQINEEKSDTSPAPAPKPKPKPKPKGKFVSKITTKTDENPQKEEEGYVPEQRRIRYDEEGDLLETPEKAAKSISLRHHEVTAEDIEQTEFYRLQLLDLYKKYDVRPPLFSKLDKDLSRWRGKEDDLLKQTDKALASGDLCGGTKGGDTTRKTVVDPVTGGAKTIIETEVDCEKSFPPSEDKFHYRNSRLRKN